MANKSTHKHDYSERVIRRHWYMGWNGVRYWCGIAKRCSLCGKIKYEKHLEFYRDSNTSPLIENYLDDLIRGDKNLEIVDDIPEHLSDLVKEYILRTCTK